MADVTPICIHCEKECNVEQVVRITRTTYLKHEDEFTPSVTPCGGCDEECTGCRSPGDRYVYFKDNDTSLYEVSPYGGEVLEGSHPINDYHYDFDNLDVVDDDWETTDVTFRCTSCGTERDHVRDLITTDAGPAIFEDGSSSKVPDPVVAKNEMVNIKINAEGQIVKASEMDDVLASIADLP